jgi:hypothetical protein
MTLNGPAAAGETRARLNHLAWLLDNSIRLPGTGFRIGLDALLGLVPVMGDVVGVLLSGYIVHEAARLGVPAGILFRMVMNVAIEGLLGAIPFAGDVFDAAWKANQRNVRLLDAWIERPARAERTSRLFIAGLAVALLAIMVVPVILTFIVLRWLTA